MRGRVDDLDICALAPESAIKSENGVLGSARAVSIKRQTNLNT